MPCISGSVGVHDHFFLARSLVMAHSTATETLAWKFFIFEGHLVLLSGNRDITTWEDRVVDIDGYFIHEEMLENRAE